jgi:hypothetical protein
MFTTTPVEPLELGALVAGLVAAGADADAGAEAGAAVAGAAVAGAAVAGTGVAADEHAAAKNVTSSSPATPRAACRRDGADMANLPRLSTNGGLRMQDRRMAFARHVG